MAKININVIGVHITNGADFGKLNKINKMKVFDKYSKGWTLFTFLLRVTDDSANPLKGLTYGNVRFTVYMTDTMSSPKSANPPQTSGMSIQINPKTSPSYPGFPSQKWHEAFAWLKVRGPKSKPWLFRVNINIGSDSGEGWVQIH